MSEFDLIRRYFTRSTPNTLLGVGDDAALLHVSGGKTLAVSTDMLVCGTHFFADADPFLLGHKTLAVNLSDLAAMGAVPRWATLALALPEANANWLEPFSAGFFALADQYGVELIGGDTTRGPLNLCVTIFGEVDAERALRRSGAKIGDEIWVSGKLGDAALALAHLQGRVALTQDEYAACASALHRPEPRVALGLALHGIASSAIDISDGLMADLGHLLDASNVGAELDVQAMPVSNTLLALSRANAHPSPACGRGVGGEGGVLQQCVLSGGDDYELCFTAPLARHTDIMRISEQLALPLTRVGRIIAEHALRDTSGNPINQESNGYDHFR
jgi:thiamine-monophosphate kinase